MSETIRVLDPQGAIYTPAQPTAKRPASLAGLRPGVLENSKHNAEAALCAIVDGLRERIALGSLTVGHKAVGLPPSKATVETLRSSCDFVLVGSSD